MKKHYSYKRIQKVKIKILNMLCEIEPGGLSLSEILEKAKDEKELVLKALDDLLNYNAFVALRKDEKYYFKV